MKRQLISLGIILPLLSGLSYLTVYAQPGDGSLPTGAKPTPTNTAPVGKPKTPTGKPTRATPNPESQIKLAIGAETSGRLDPGRRGASGISFAEYILDAKSEDWLTFHLETPGGDNSTLDLKISGSNHIEVPIKKDVSGDFRISTNTGGLPDDGEYHIRVTSATTTSKGAIPFKIRVNRLGLTGSAYIQRYGDIYNNYDQRNPASVQETIAKLERLGKDDPYRSNAFEMLGIIYIEALNNVEKAEAAMEQSIKANGSAIIQIELDGPWRNVLKLHSINSGFDAIGLGWLKISQGHLVVTDLGNKQLAVLNKRQIKDISKSLSSSYDLVTITSEIDKHIVFSSRSMKENQVDLIVKMIKRHVMGS